MWSLVQFSVIPSVSQCGVQQPLLFSFPEAGALCSIPSCEGSILDTAPDQGGIVLPKCKLCFGITVTSSKIAPDILPLPGESPHISSAVDARDVLIFIFYRPRCVEKVKVNCRFGLSFQSKLLSCTRGDRWSKAVFGAERGEQQLGAAWSP